jgi:hypothetical protein
MNCENNDIRLGVKDITNFRLLVAEAGRPMGITSPTCWAAPVEISTLELNVDQCGIHQRSRCRVGTSLNVNVFDVRIFDVSESTAETKLPRQLPCRLRDAGSTFRQANIASAARK